jgi:uncharacterized protein (TIGR03437 family)
VSLLILFAQFEIYSSLKAQIRDSEMKITNYSALLLVWAITAAAAAAQAQRALYQMATVAGSGQMGDGGPATAAQMGAIQGVAVDRLGNVYLSDSDHHRVRKIDAKGIITTIAGTGLAGFSGDGGPATAAQLDTPYGLAVDLAGAVYVADYLNNRVRRIGPDGVITTFAGSGGNASSGDGGPATAAQLLEPRNVAVDAAGNLYISEYGANRVRKVTLDGNIHTAAGTGLAGYNGDGYPAVVTQLNQPAGLAVDRTGVLYIADWGNSLVRKVLPDGLMSIVVGEPPGVSTKSPNIQLYLPVAVAVDLNQNLYVAEDSTIVHKYTAAGAWIAAAGTNTGGFFGDGGPATAAGLTSPRDVAADLAGNLYIADGVRIREVSNGTIRTIAGDDYMHIGDGASATAAQLFNPSALWLDAGGNLLIADTGTQRVRQVDSSGIITTLAGTGVAAPNTEGAVAAAAPLFDPVGVVKDPAGNVLILESDRIQEVGVDGRIRTVMGTGSHVQSVDGLPPIQTSLVSPHGMCIDRTGTVYVADAHRILKWPPGGVVTTVAGNGLPGAAGDGGQATLAQLWYPYACDVDSFGNLYIADTDNHRIRKVDAGGVITTVAGTGLPGYGGDEGPATSADLWQPAGVAADDNGDIFISDTANNRIRQVTPDGVIHTIAGTGATSFGGDGGAALNAQINGPAGILLDGSGDLYFADTNNNRVRLMVPNGVISPPPVVVLPPLAVANAASRIAGPVAPGELVTITGAGLGPPAGVGGTYDASGLLANQLAGTEVRFDGVPAPLLYAQASQINAQVPYTVSGNNTTHMEVFYQGKSAGMLDLTVTANVPAVFSTVVQQDGTYNSQTNPAPHGTFLTIYATGDGIEYGPDLAGLPAAVPYPFPVLPVTVTLAGMAAEVVYAGSAPGLVGILQVDARVPGSFVPSGAVPLVLTVGTVQAPAVTVWVQ